jgi:hypothetical protein
VPVDLGDTYTSSIEVYDKPPELGGVLIDPATCTLTITLPDGSVLAGTTPNHTAVGKFKYDYVTTVPGRIPFRWLTTAPNTAYTDEINVAPADPGLIVSLAVVKDHLNIASSTQDEELRRLIAAATSQIEYRVGPVARKSVTERVTLAWGQRQFWLGQAPVIAVTSMTAVTTGASTIDPLTLAVDPATGAVGFLSPWSYFPAGTYTVTYTAGRAVVDEGIVSAALAYIRGAWETQRGAAGLPLQGSPDEQYQPGMGLVMWRLENDLAPFRRGPAVA